MITGIELTWTNPTDFAQTNNCGSSVAAGARCTFNVTFTPATTGSLQAALSIYDNASGGQQSQGLYGTGSSSAPLASLSPSSLTFASQAVGATSAAQTLTLSNTGNAALSITSITLTGTNPGDFAQTNTCGSSVAAGANCSISVSFKPTASGSRTATVTVTDNATGSPQSVSLSGTGAVASPVITSATAWNETVGTAVSYPITATNSPTSYGATGLPAGLSVNSATGLISGSPRPLEPRR